MTLVSLQMTGSDQITENINAFFTSDVGTNSEQSDGSDAVMQMQSFQLKESPGPKQYSMGMLTSLLQPTSINCMRMSRSSVERVLSGCMNTSKRIHYRHYYNYSESNNHTISGSSTLAFHSDCDNHITNKAFTLDLLHLLQTLVTQRCDTH